MANTKMRYNGLSNQQARTDLLAFLLNRSDHCEHRRERSRRVFIV